MAPIKYEEQMKDKLEKRRLQPSPKSWETLANRLDADEKAPFRFKLSWLAIAASVIGILFVTTMYFNNRPVETTTETIVNTENNNLKEKMKGTKEFTIEQTQKINDVAVEKVNSGTTIQNNDTSNANSSSIVTNSSAVNEKKQHITAQIRENEMQSTLASNVKDTSEETVVALKSSKLTFEDQKVQDVVAQIKGLKSNGSNVTNTEIDSLLKKAQQEILSNRLYNESTRMVDANALLQSVEADLEQSFRSRVFEALQSGYESVKTRVVQRIN